MLSYTRVFGIFTEFNGTVCQAPVPLFPELLLRHAEHQLVSGQKCQMQLSGDAFTCCRRLFRFVPQRDDQVANSRRLYSPKSSFTCQFIGQMLLIPNMRKNTHTVNENSIVLGHMNAALRQFSKPCESRYTRSLMSPSSGENQNGPNNN